ncbi:MAG TPA: O-methyltransferase [Chloroflexota bacterium]|nr:O-methyltransferase [Chloroflexota bacterium]
MATPSRTRRRFIDEDISRYASAHSTPPDAVQLELQRVTQERTGRHSQMQIGDDQAVLMESIVRAMGARSAVELGTFTGYSSIAIARGLGPQGKLLCCDVSEEWTSIAREFWGRAGVADRIELRIGPGMETLRSLPQAEQFDFAFVDADKPGYPDYFRELLPRLRPGGLILVDNTLQSGKVLDNSNQGENVAAIREFNELVARDPRVRIVLVPIGDGVTFIQKQ